jgi:hypothetical protein
MNEQRGYVVGNGVYISTVTHRRWDATPENLDALKADNRLYLAAHASRPPEQSRTTVWRIAQESSAANPTGPDVWQHAIQMQKALIATGGFRDQKRIAEVDEMELQSKAFQERKAKLLDLRPEQQPAPDPVRQAAESLKKNPGNLGERLADKIAGHLLQKADEQDAAADAAAKESARTSAPEYVRAFELQRGEVFLYERTTVPAELLANAKKLLVGLEDGSVSAKEYWGCFEPEQSAAKYAYIDGLTIAKKAEIKKLRDDLKVIDDLEPPAAAETVT